MAPGAARPAIRPCILVTNDDGIEAPGLRQLVAVVSAMDFCDIYVSAPDGERSAQSSKITLGLPLTVKPWNVEGAVDGGAFTTDGSPADSAMLALNSNLFGGRTFDLIVSGINRGDNCGMHVVYSGTVGAAREGAMLGIPALALSLDNYRGPPDYRHAATIAAALIRAVLGLLPLPGLRPYEQAAALQSLRGTVINVNFPMRSLEDTKGLFVTYQGLSTLMIHWSEVQGAEAQALASSEEALEKEVDLYQGGGAPPTPEGGESGRGSAQEGARASSGVAGAGGAPRVFRKRYGKLVFDETPASDAWAMHNGWVSVTLLSLQQDIVGACRDAYRACAGAVEGCGQGVLPDESAPHAEDVVLSPHRARSSLPFDFMGDAERIVAARFGDSRLAALGAVTQAAGVALGKEVRLWTSFRDGEESLQALRGAEGR